MIGDRKHDILGALANGVTAIGVLWGYGSAAELTDANATHEAARIAQALLKSRVGDGGNTAICADPGW